MPGEIQPAASHEADQPAEIDVTTLGEFALFDEQDLNCRMIIPPHTAPIVLTGPRDVEQQDRDLVEIFGL